MLHSQFSLSIVWGKDIVIMNESTSVSWITIPYVSWQQISVYSGVTFISLKRNLSNMYANFYNIFFCIFGDFSYLYFLKNFCR